MFFFCEQMEFMGDVELRGIPQTEYNVKYLTKMVKYSNLYCS